MCLSAGVCARVYAGICDAGKGATMFQVLTLCGAITRTGPEWTSQTTRVIPTWRVTARPAPRLAQELADPGDGGAPKNIVLRPMSLFLGLHTVFVTSASTSHPSISLNRKMD